MTHFSARKQLTRLGYDQNSARRWGRKLQRHLDFHEIVALFAGDPTATVAALRTMGIPAPARYAQSRPKMVVS